MRAVSIVLGFAALTAACHSRAPVADDGDAGITVTVTAADAPIDPEAMALITPVESCKIEDGFFHACAAADPFRKSVAGALVGEKGDALLLTMLTSPDEHYRILATTRGMDDAAKVVASKVNAERVMGQLERETNRGVRDSLVDLAGRIDVEKFGLLDRLTTLSASKDVVVRKSVASYLLTREGPAVRVGIVARLLEDPVADVHRRAAAGLSVASMSGRDEAMSACAPMMKALDGPYADDIVWHVSDAQRCPGIQAKALAYVDSKTANPATITNHTGIDYSLAIRAVCEGPDASLKPRAYDAAARFVSTADPDPNTRTSAVRTLAKCDPVRAKAKLAVLAKDKDKDVADEAKKELAQLH